MPELKQQLANLMLAYNSYKAKKYTPPTTPQVKKGGLSYEDQQAQRKAKGES